MKVTFYKYWCNHSGFYTQIETIDKIEFLTKKEILKIADLRHPILTKNEFYNTLSTDIKGRLKEKFELLTNTHLIIVETKIN
jgi:hypothetical protein